MIDATPLLAATDLAAERGGRVLFSGVAVALHASQIVYLQGPNGVGKSTLMRMLAGLTQASAGRVDRRALPLYWGHAAAVKDELTAPENLSLLMASSDVGRSAQLDALTRCGLSERLHVLARRLSAGQRRRILLARLFLAQEKIWLLDEPTAALDKDGLALLAEALNAHRARGGAALIATHVALSGLLHAPSVMELHR